MIIPTYRILLVMLPTTHFGDLNVGFLTKVQNYNPKYGFADQQIGQSSRTSTQQHLSAATRFLSRFTVVRCCIRDNPHL